MRLLSANLLKAVTSKPGQTLKEIAYEVRNEANQKTVYDHLKLMASNAMIRKDDTKRPHTFYPV